MKHNLNITSFIALLPIQMQEEIKKELLDSGIKGKELEIALSGRLCDLEELVDLKLYKEKLATDQTIRCE